MDSDSGKVHRMQEPLKSVEEMLEAETFEGLSQINRQPFKLFLSSISAGLDVGFSILALGVVTAFLAPMATEAGMPAVKFIALLFYPIGFLFVIFGKSELFTAHTVTGLLPILEGVAPWYKLLMLWGVVYAGNLIGAALFSLGLSVLSPVTPDGTAHALEEFAEHLLNVPAWSIVVSGIFGGWLMALIAWIKNSPRDSITIVVLIYLITFLIGAVPLHHSIVGSVEVFAGMAYGAAIDFGQYFSFLFLSTFGNIIGGIVFVTLFKWGHARPDDGV